ncbi:MAG TPA: hypothetical protein VFA99_10510 [Acidobacteriaceae bacterium]|nr:hypothetical protein [Acidobacteriaceae bacterium]
MNHHIDPAAVYAEARTLNATYGIGAETEALRRILEANSKGDAQQEAFWQEVSRALQLPGYFYPGL